MCLLTACGGGAPAAATTTAAATTAAPTTAAPETTTTAATTAAPETTTEAATTTATTTAAPTTTAAAATEAATAAPEPEPELEVYENNIVKIVCPADWIYNEERSNVKETFGNFRFDYFGEDEDKPLYNVFVYACEEQVSKYRKPFIEAGFDLKDLADGKLDGMDVNGTTFYKSRPGTLRYRNETTGTNYVISFDHKDEDISGSPFIEFINGVTIDTAAGGMAPIPWPWEGARWEPDLKPQMVGSFTLSAEFLPTEEPYVVNSAMKTSFTVVKDLIYLVLDETFSAYRIEGGGLTLENSVELDAGFEKIRSDSTGRLYMSPSSATATKVSVYDGFEKILATEAKRDLEMHKSGKWGITYWVNSDPLKVTVDGDIFKSEPWIYKNMNKTDGTREAKIDSIRDLRITDSYILVSGGHAEEKEQVVVVYDHNDNEKFELEWTMPDRSGLGSITGMVETKNGFLATDGNMRQIVLWNKDGAYMGMIKINDLIGASYCWPEDLYQMDDGSIILAITQERQDKSADELLFFRLTGF